MYYCSRQVIGKTELTLDNCVVETKKQQCGVYAEVCPSEPLAIMIQGSAIHGLAEEVVEKEPVIIPVEEGEEEFPF